MNKIKSVINWLMKDKKRLAGAAVLLILLIFGLAKIFGPKTNQAQLQTTKVERGTIISSVTASGQVLTANIVNLNSDVSGLVKTVYVKDGDLVMVGQKIMEITLDSAGQQKAAAAYSSYLASKNSLDSARTTMYSLQSDMLTKWKTFKDLAESSSYQNADGSPRNDQRVLPQFIISQDDWLATEAKYKNQTNVISQVQSALNNAWLSYQLVSPIITAPMSGTITNLTYSPGMTIGASTDTSGTDAGQRIAVILSPGNPLATFNISELDVSKVKPGQKATIKLDILADKTYTGKVLTVDRIGTLTSGVTNYPVVIQFDTETPEVLPNMSTTTSIILETKDNVLLILSSAIRVQGEQNTVRILKNKKEQTVVVETGLTSDTQTEIISGLSEGDEVITGSTTNTSSTRQGTSSPFSGQLRIGGGGFGR